MRPAIEVLAEVMDAYFREDRVENGEAATAVIEADRAELVAEIVAMIHEQFDAPHIIDAGRKVAAMIETQFGGRDGN